MSTDIKMSSRPRPKPAYELKDYSSDSDRPVRFCCFRYEQDIQTVSIILDNLTSIDQHPKNKLKAHVTKKSMHFTIEGYELSDVHLVLSKLAHQIIPSQTRIIVKDENTISIVLSKIKPQIWKSVIFVSILVKNKWIKAIKGFLLTYFQGKCQMNEVDDIWGRVEGLFTDDINFYLNPPQPFGPLKVLETAKTVEDVIKIVKKFTLSRRGDKKVDATMPYFLGAAILFELIESFPAFEPKEECAVSLEPVTLRGNTIVDASVSQNLGGCQRENHNLKNDTESRKQIMKYSETVGSVNINNQLSNRKIKSDEAVGEKVIPTLSNVCPKSKKNSWSSNKKDRRNGEYLPKGLNLESFDGGSLHKQTLVTRKQDRFQNSSCDISHTNYNVLNDKGSYYGNQIQKCNSKFAAKNDTRRGNKAKISIKSNVVPILTNKSNKNKEELFPNCRKQKNGTGSCKQKENLPQHCGRENISKEKDAVKSVGTNLNIAKADISKESILENAAEMKSKGNEFFKAQNYLKARDCYTFAIDLNQDNSVYYTNRAACFLKLEQYKECFDDAYKAYNLDPSSPKAYYYMGKSALHTGWICMGVSYLSMAARLNPVCIEDVLKELQIGHQLKEKVIMYITYMQERNILKSQKLLTNIDKFCKIGVTELRERMYTDFLQGGQSMNIKFLATADLAFNAKDHRAIYYLATSNFHLNLKDEALDALLLFDAIDAVDSSYLFRIMELKNNIDRFYYFKEKGDNAYRIKNFNKAQEWYLLCVDVDSLNKSENAKLYCKLGDINMAKADYDEAVRYFTLSRNQDYTLLEPRMKMIECYEKMGQYYNATKEAIDISELTCSEEEHSMFLDQLEYGIKKCEFETNVHVKEGDKHQSAGKYALAIDCYSKSLLSEADCAHLFIKRSQCYLEINEYRLAFLDAVNAVKLEPFNAEYCLQMGKCCISIGIIDIGESRLKLAIKIDPTLSEVLTELRKVQRLRCLITLSEEEIENKNFEVASSLLKDAVSIAKGYYELPLRRAECLILIDNWDEIDSIINYLMNGKDERPEYECLLGMQCYYKGILEESILHLKKALEIEPEHSNSLELMKKSKRFLKIINKGDVAFSKLNFETSLSLYKSGFNVDTQNKFLSSLLHFKVGLVLIEKNNMLGAIEAFSSAISIRSHFLDAYLNRAKCNLQIRKRDLAANDYRMVCQLFPNDEHDKLLQNVLRIDEENLGKS